jgi:hypothetical protein
MTTSTKKNPHLHLLSYEDHCGTSKAKDVHDDYNIDTLNTRLFQVKQGTHTRVGAVREV